jgi:plastocyanin
MPNPPALGATEQANTVSITDGSFSPESIRIAPGSTVKWVNNGQHNHTVTATDGAWDSGNIPPGQSYNHTFKNAGTFRYKCSLDPQKMEGKVIVEQAGAATRQPGE